MSYLLRHFKTSVHVLLVPILVDTFWLTTQGDNIISEFFLSIIKVFYNLLKQNCLINRYSSWSSISSVITNIRTISDLRDMQ